MIRKTASLISHISHLFTLEPGDVILTGKDERRVWKEDGLAFQVSLVVVVLLLLS